MRLMKVNEVSVSEISTVKKGTLPKFLTGAARLGVMGSVRSGVGTAVAVNDLHHTRHVPVVKKL